MISIVRGLLPRLVDSAADLFLKALGEKFKPIFGNKCNTEAFLKSTIALNKCLSATEEDMLLELLAKTEGFKTTTLQVVDTNPRAVAMVLT